MQQQEQEQEQYDEVDKVLVVVIGMIACERRPDDPHFFRTTQTQCSTTAVGCIAGERGILNIDLPAGLQSSARTAGAVVVERAVADVDLFRGSRIAIDRTAGIVRVIVGEDGSLNRQTSAFRTNAAATIRHVASAGQMQTPNRDIRLAAGDLQNTRRVVAADRQLHGSGTIDNQIFRHSGQL